MTRILKKVICLALGVIAACDASGFSMWGPPNHGKRKTWIMASDICHVFRCPTYNLLRWRGPGSLYSVNTELGGTKNFSEGSRLNIPIITYAYDYTFLNYFGAKGVAAVDSAFAVMNGLPSGFQRQRQID